MIDTLAPLPVVGPLAVAGLLLAISRVLPRYVPDAVALVTVCAAGVLCAVMAAHTMQTPFVYWFGGWIPRHGFPIGISFVVDPAGAALAAFIALLFAATLVFAWGYYDEVHAYFHVLMLLFMAGMIGFCLTHDLFDMFVWFEVMSVAGFALTGYQLRSSALEGALNFTVTNTIGSYLILVGIGLLYLRLGVLDFSALAQGVAEAPGDIAVEAGFVAVVTGLLIKAAQVPFQFWLADAHAVAPSPVSVIFSGAMVAIGVFGIARLDWAIFAPSPDIQRVVHGLLLGMGSASAVLGGVMTILQRHVKRLLAFSTISHVGVLMIGVALLDQKGLAGMFVYLVGHGLVKAALFMVAGILLATKAGIDEIGLRGLGRDIWPAGIAMVVGGLLLAGLPMGAMEDGAALIYQAAKIQGCPWVLAAIVIGNLGTGAAVLRASGRIFLGLGPVPGEEKRGPTEAEQEKADRPLWLMLAPVALLLLLALCCGSPMVDFFSLAMPGFMHPDNAAILGLAPLHPAHPSTMLIPPSSGAVAWVSVGLALAIAILELERHRLPPALVRRAGRLVDMPLTVLQHLHSGVIGDYIAWLVFGLALFVLAFAVL